MLVLTLLSLGVVGLRRTWDLRGYTGDALGLLSGRIRAYGYLHTERMLSEVARAQGDVVFTDALARWTAQLWQVPGQGRFNQPKSFYVDGHRKPVSGFQATRRFCTSKMGRTTSLTAKSKRRPSGRLVVIALTRSHKAAKSRLY
jgi:hypothetical protein